jgi:hypothetical protein
LRGWVPLLAFLFIHPVFVFGQTIAAGRTIDVRLEHSVTTKTASVGNSVVARVDGALKDGSAIVVPSGSRLHGRVEFVERKSVTDDGSLRLLFSRFELPDGRSIETLASASFRMDKPRGKKDYVVAMFSFAAIGAFLGGRNKRVSGGLGGAIVGLLVIENKHRFGRDLTLRAGRTIQLRLSADLISASPTLR